jgi:hypothetical protein
MIAGRPDDAPCELAIQDLGVMLVVAGLQPGGEGVNHRVGVGVHHPDT